MIGAHAAAPRRLTGALRIGHGHNTPKPQNPIPLHPFSFNKPSTCALAKKLANRTK